MLLSLSGTYVLLAFAAAATSYVLAQRKGRNAVGWAWLSLLLLVPALILPFLGSRRAPPAANAVTDETWQALLAYDPEIRAAATRLAPYGAPALDALHRLWTALPDKAALPAMVDDIAARGAAQARAGLVHVETQDGVSVLRDAAGRYHVGERQTDDLGTARLMAMAAARRTGPSMRAGVALIGGVVVAGLVMGSGGARAQADAVAMTPPSCEAYQRERPRGGDPEQLSDLFGLSLYRWDEADFARYRAFLLECKRSLPGLRADLTLAQWAELTHRSVTDLRQYSGLTDRLGTPMGNRRGPRPRPGEPDRTLAFRGQDCDRFRQGPVNAWARGGPPDATPAAPYGVPLAAWRYEVWRAFENRVLACGRQGGTAAEADESWMRVIVGALETNHAPAIRQAQQDAGAAQGRLAGILARAGEAEGLSSADEIAGKLAAVTALAAEPPTLSPAEDAQVAAARERIATRLRAARLAEAEAWERDRPAREARARQQETELAELQRRNREREAEIAGERERAARIEGERRAGARAEAERRMAETEAQRGRDDDQRAADQAARETAEAEQVARIRREDQARLASDPCNQPAMRRQLMEAANAMDGVRRGGRRLLDLTDGRSLPAEGGTTRACLFVADWSSGQRGLVTITLRKNSFGDELIEVRPF